MIKLRPYKLGSKSAKDLATALGVKRLRPNSSYRPPSRALVVNWGNSQATTHSNLLNAPGAVSKACNKLSSLRILKDAGISVPDFTTNKQDASEWQEDGFKVVARKLLNSHSGNGIVICGPDDAIVDAPLYTKYTRKEKEYRIHVFGGKIIDIAEKRKRSGIEATNSYVRTLNNGWVYCRTNISIADVGKKLALDAVKALGLDFGAVDLIEGRGKYYVLECNTAPGLSGTTLTSYVNAIKEYARGRYA